MTISIFIICCKSRYFEGIVFCLRMIYMVYYQNLITTTTLPNLLNLGRFGLTILLLFMYIIYLIKQCNNGYTGCAVRGNITKHCISQSDSSLNQQGSPSLLQILAC